MTDWRKCLPHFIAWNPLLYFFLSHFYYNMLCIFVPPFKKNCNCAFNCEASPSQCCACVRDSQFNHSVLLWLRWAGLDYAVVDCFLFLLSGDGSTEGCVLANKIEEHLFCDQGFLHQSGCPKTSAAHRNKVSHGLGNFCITIHGAVPCWKDSMQTTNPLHVVIKMWEY